MKKYLFLIALFTGSIVMAQPPSGNAEKGDAYGDVSALKDAKLLKGISKLESGKKLDGNMTGTVKEVCPKKGCWIKLELPGGKIATVKMKNYSFFVPVALEGKKVLINGNVELKITTVAELKHLAEDAKKPQSEIDAINTPSETLTIIANGIKVQS